MATTMELGLWSVISSESVIHRLWFSLWLSSVVTLVAVTLGGGLAVVERLQRLTTPRWFTALCTVPIFLPPVIVGTGFIHLFGQAGDINDALALFGLPSVHLLYRPLAVLIAHAYYNIPLAYVALRAASQNIAPYTEDAARLCGARTSALLRQLYWPNLKRALAGIAAIIFLYNFTSFVLPLLLGGIQAQTLEVWLYQRIYLWHDYATAVRVAILQTIILATVIGVLLRGRIFQFDRMTPVSGAQPTPAGLSLARAIIAAALIAPLLSLILHALRGSTWPVFITLAHTNFFPGVLRSALLVAVVGGLTIGISLFVRGSFSWSILWLTLSPVTLAFLWLVSIGQGYLSLGLALVCGFLPIAGYFIDQARKQQPRAWPETAQCVGATAWQQHRLELQFLRPTVLRLTGLVSVFVLGDVTLATLLAPHAAPTGMQVALNLISNYRFQLGSLAMVIMLIIIIGLQLLLYARR